MRFLRSKYLQQLLAGRGNGMVKIIMVHEDILPRRDEKGIVTMGLKQFLTDVHAIETA